MVWHVQQSVVGREVVEGEQGTESSLLSVRNRAGFSIEEPGFDFTVDGAEETGAPDEDAGEVELFVLDGSIFVRLDVGVLG